MDFFFLPCTQMIYIALFHVAGQTACALYGSASCNNAPEFLLILASKTTMLKKPIDQVDLSSPSRSLPNRVTVLQYYYTAIIYASSTCVFHVKGY